MKNIISLFLIFIISFSFINAQAEQPDILVKNDQYDFGDVKEGEIVAHDFVIVNNGDGILKIDKIRASCGCTAADPDKKELKPGELTVLHVKFNTTRRSGKQKKHVYIFSNDPDTPHMRVSFTANIIPKERKSKVINEKTPRLELEKNRYDFGKVEEGQVVDFELSFKNTGKNVLHIKDVKTSCGCTAALLSSKQLSPNEEGTIKIELDTKNRSGYFSRTVTIVSDDPYQPQQTITLFANVIKRKS